jgi:hypothetical protein
MGRTRTSRRFLVAATAVALLAASPARAEATGAASPQEPSRAGSVPPQDQADAADLAKKLSNPISDLVSVPFQFNWEQGVEPDDATRFILNIQPVMPFSMTKDWNLIARVIMPVVGQPPLTPGGEAASGVSDILASFFFSPKAGKLIWGVGPVLSLPSTSEPTLGSGKWSAGPTFVVLKQAGRWTYGALANQIWSFAGEDGRADVSQMFLQPFLSYTTPKAITYTIQSETTANWEAASGQEWTIPINFLFSKVLKFGPFPASYQVGAGWFAESPDVGGADWKLRAAIVILLPRRG